MTFRRPAMLALGLSTIALCTIPASAAGTSIAVPAIGPKTVSTTFSGTFPVGANVASWAAGDVPGCQGDAPAQFVESHPIKVTVPANAYKTVKATMAVTVDPTVTLDSGGDLMELLDPSGTSVGTDGQKTEEEIDVTNPMPGTWTLLTCQFLPSDAGTDNYTGTVTIKTKCKAASPCPAVKPKGKK